MYPPVIVRFEDGIVPDDIRQGSLGDCWLMCAMSAAAEFPDIVRRCVSADKKASLGVANDLGLYTIRFGQHVDVGCGQLAARRRCAYLFVSACF